MENETPYKKTDNLLPFSIFLSALILAGAWMYKKQPEKPPVTRTESIVAEEPSTVLPVVWGDLGAKLVSVGAIDEGAFRTLYQTRDVWTPEYEQLLTGSGNGAITITKENAGVLLNFLWALGLASKNPILESGEMQNPAYGGAENFASTAGWTIAKGSPMEHYSRHMFFALTPEQQKLVDKLSRKIYRPCCNNSAHFPDCNHGMAMLGLLELMASQGVNEQDMMKTALVVNSYWFPETNSAGCAVETAPSAVPKPRQQSGGCGV